MTSTRSGESTDPTINDRSIACNSKPAIRYAAISKARYQKHIWTHQRHVGTLDSSRDCEKIGLHDQHPAALLQTVERIKLSQDFWAIQVNKKISHNWASSIKLMFNEIISKAKCFFCCADPVFSVPWPKGVAWPKCLI